MTRRAPKGPCGVLTIFSSVLLLTVSVHLQVEQFSLCIFTSIKMI